MRLQPPRSYVLTTNDNIQTPDELAYQVSAHYLGAIRPHHRPYTRILEPCAGSGAFVRAFNRLGFNAVETCEVQQGSDFYEYQPVTGREPEWLITNCPWSQVKPWMEKSFSVCDNVVLLATLNHLTGLKARRRIMRDAGFSVREILHLDTPPAPWPQSGFQLAAVHFQKDYSGPIIVSDEPRPDLYALDLEPLPVPDSFGRYRSPGEPSPQLVLPY